MRMLLRVFPNFFNYISVFCKIRSCVMLQKIFFIAIYSTYDHCLYFPSFPSSRLTLIFSHLYRVSIILSCFNDYSDNMSITESDSIILTYSYNYVKQIQLISKVKLNNFIIINSCLN